MFTFVEHACATHKRNEKRIRLSCRALVYAVGYQGVGGGKRTRPVIRPEVFGLHLSTPDLAKFGQCLLDGGKWRGEQIIPAEWVAEAAKVQMETKPLLSARGD